MKTRKLVDILHPLANSHAKCTPLRTHLDNPISDEAFCDTPNERLSLLSRYFSTSRETLQMLVSLPRGPIRKEASERLEIDQYILRTMLEYTRYPEARSIGNALDSLGVEMKQLIVVDFGSLAADYGIYFARRGASVRLYDKPPYIEFGKFRFESESLTVDTFSLSTSYLSLFAEVNLAIFGEVLEHLENPLAPIYACFQAGVQFLYTSCYPFGDDYYFSQPGHSARAHTLQPICLEFLRQHYNELDTGKRSRLWERRNL